MKHRSRRNPYFQPPPPPGSDPLETVLMVTAGALGLTGVSWAAWKLLQPGTAEASALAFPSPPEAPAMDAIDTSTLLGFSPMSAADSSGGGLLTGSAFLASVQGLPDATREQAVIRAALAGSIPARSRPSVPIPVSAGGHSGFFYVAPDVLAIGTDGDFVRTPLGARGAQSLADQLGWSLLTKRMSDLVWSAGTVKLDPESFSPASGESHNALRLWIASHQAIEQQRAGRDGLVVGINKDEILSRENAAHPGKVTIYGWHRPTGRPIQGGPPFYTGHSDTYTDYSQAPRYAAGMIVDGQQVRVEDVLKDATLAPLLSDEGRIPDPGYR
jgi:hypothetical protein